MATDRIIDIRQFREFMLSTNVEMTRDEGHKLLRVFSLPDTVDEYDVVQHLQNTGPCASDVRVYSRFYAHKAGRSALHIRDKPSQWTPKPLDFLSYRPFLDKAYTLRRIAADLGIRNSTTLYMYGGEEPQRAIIVYRVPRRVRVYSVYRVPRRVRVYSVRQEDLYRVTDPIILYSVPWNRQRF